MCRRKIGPERRAEERITCEVALWDGATRDEDQSEKTYGRASVALIEDCLEVRVTVRMEADDATVFAWVVEEDPDTVGFGVVGNVMAMFREEMEAAFEVTTTEPTVTHSVPTRRR